MANKDDDDVSASSASTSDSEEVSEDETNGNAISPIPSIQPQDQGGDGAAAMDRFLEQVAGSVLSNGHTEGHTDGHTDGCSDRGPQAAARDTDMDRWHAKCVTDPPQCRCQLNAGRPCHTRFSMEELKAIRQHYLTLSRKELDIAVLAKLECGIHLTDMTTRKKRKPTTRKKHRTDFYHRGFRICNVMFVYLHGFSYKKLKALILQYKANGVRTRIHKNIKAKPPDISGQSSKKKKKTKAKVKPKDSKAKKAGVKKRRKDSSMDNKKEECTFTSLHNSLPSAKHPFPPSAPTSQPTYPLAFPLTNPTHLPPPAPLITPTQAPFPHSGGYSISGGSLFPPHPITVHTTIPQPSNGVSIPSMSHVDYSSHLGLPMHPLDGSGPSTTIPHPGNAFPSTPGPCVNYGVVSNEAFKADSAFSSIDLQSG